MTQQELTAKLEAIRNRAEDEKRGAGLAPEDPSSSADDALVLLAVADAVLKLHRSNTLYKVAIWSHDPDERIHCGHTRAEMENGQHGPSTENDDLLCLGQPEAEVCEECWDNGGEQVEWPCPTYRAVCSALGSDEKGGA